MKIGYGTVSTRDQNPEAQHDALEATGRDQVFVDKARGKLGRRPELDNADSPQVPPATNQEAAAGGAVSRHLWQKDVISRK